MTTLTSLLIGLALAAKPLPLNQATAEELASLEGIDQETADAVVGLRTQRGRLGSVEELRILTQVDDTELGVLRQGTAMDFTVGATEKREFRTVDEVLAAFDHEPTVELVQRWAMQYANTHPEAVASWWSAARKAKLLPTFAVGYQYDDDYGEDFDYTTDDVTGEVSASLDRVDRDRDHRAAVVAKWDLDDLLMSSNHMRVVSESRKTVELRDEINEEITSLYFERRRHQVEMLLSPSRDLKAQVEDTLKLMELTAQLDAYTGGRFSDRLASDGQ